MRESRLPLIPFVVTFLFLYTPIVIVVVMSFNASQNPFVWGGFSLEHYPAVFASRAIMDGLGNTLIVAAWVTVLSTVLGTLMAVGIHRYVRNGLLRALAVAPALMPDLLLAIGLLSLLSLVSLGLGLHSVIISHVVFIMAFVTAIVLARMSRLDPSLEEASKDLGATPLRTFLRVTLPQLTPAVVAGALLSFTLSIDEFVVAFFLAAPQSPTLPITIYSMVRFGVGPEINALATMLLGVSLVAVVAVQRLTKVTRLL